jgi:biopolymer transport protein ExbD
MSEINLTSLLDVAFVLLIAFMLIAPTLRDGVEIRLPSVQNAPVLPQASTQPLTIRIPEAGPLTLDDQELSPEGLEETLRQSRKDNPSVAVVLEADRNVPYQRVAEAMAAIRRAGISGVGLPMVSLERAASPAPTQPARP